MGYQVSKVTERVRIQSNRYCRTAVKSFIDMFDEVQMLENRVWRNTLTSVHLCDDGHDDVTCQIPYNIL